MHKSTADARARLQRIEALFHGASNLPDSEREFYLHRECGDDPSLAGEVLRLLEAESALNELKSASGEVPKQGAPLSDELMGRTLGSFRLEQLLGRGGMGVVYLGSRIGEGLSQRVAVKLMAYHLESSPARSQFLMEREVLAELEHPNIARLVDGGVAPEGLPYLVMEYVEGRRLDAVCDLPETTLKTIASLMIQLCSAVSYVHRNLILHRDLKPGNVMVTDDGQVKLIDFGTLKGLGPRFAEDSAMTRAGMRSLTLRYASPEQIRGELPSTAMDVYSLGMVLYRLIAGDVPKEMNELSISEHLRQLEGEGFAAPSTVGPARRRQADAMLASDLDAIAMKAIRYQAQDRYDGVDAIARDLQRALERRPVSARADTVRYRSVRFLRRNRTLVAGAAVATLVLGLGVSAMAHEAGVARAQSLRATAGLEEERKLAHLLLSDYFTQLRDIPGSTQAQNKAVSQAIGYLDELNRGTTDPSLQLESLQAYRKMGSLLGSPYEANLGDAPRAIATLDRGQPLLRKLLARDPRSLDYLTAAAGLETAFGQVYLGEGDGRHALPHLLAAAAFAKKVADDPRATSKMLIQSAAVSKTLADAYGEHGDANTRDPAKVVSALQQSGAYYERALAIEPHCCQRGLTIVQVTLGELLEDTDVAQALAAYQRGLDVIASLPPAEQNTIGFIRLTGTLRMHLGSDDLILHRRAQGEALLMPEFQRERNAIASDAIDARAREDLIDLDSTAFDGYRELGDQAEEEVLLREYLENLRILIRTHPDNAIWTPQQTIGQLRLASLLKQEHRAAESQALAAVALPGATAAAALPNADARTLQTAADFLIPLGNNRAQDSVMALSLAQRLVATDGSAPSASHLLTLARAEQGSGHTSQAEMTANAALREIKRHPRGLEYTVQLVEVRPLSQSGMVR